MKWLLLFVMILCIAIWLGVGAQEDVAEPVVTDVEEELVEPIEPTVKPVTRLSVTLIDEVNDQFIKLENCMVRVVGELHMVEDSFNYQNTFLQGDRYSITIWVKIKK